MNRRNMAFGALAALAAAAGVSVAWWRHGHDGSDDQTGPGVKPPAGPVAGAAASQPRFSETSAVALENFWTLNFDDPAGNPLAMASLRGNPLLVNFWATWCPPCIEELPLLDSFYRSYQSKGWQVIGLAVDQPSAVQKWLKSRPLSFPVGMAGFQGTELVKSFGNASGSLPFTLVVSAAGSVIARKTGKVTPDELQVWAARG